MADEISYEVLVEKPEMEPEGADIEAELITMRLDTLWLTEVTPKTIDTEELEELEAELESPGVELTVDAKAELEVDPEMGVVLMDELDSEADAE